MESILHAFSLREPTIDDSEIFARVKADGHGRIRRLTSITSVIPQKGNRFLVKDSGIQYEIKVITKREWNMI